MHESVKTSTSTAANAENLARGLAFLRALIRARVSEESTGETPPLPRPSVVDDESPFAALVRRHAPSFDEYTTLMLGLAPHLQPRLLGDSVGAALSEGSDLPQFGGRRHRDSRVLVATGETACFLLAGDDLSSRFDVQRLFEPDHWFAREGVLRLEEPESGAPRLSGRLLVAPDWIERLTTGRERAPSFSSAFPARAMTTLLEWEDLVLEPAALEQLDVVRRWLRHRVTLATRSMPPGRLRPGYRALFHGPPGTGKTLAASLLAKLSGRKAYRVDLSMVVSKYIGETEKNLAALFDVAQHRDWILFFDEADALFGKRTAVKDSHDRFANQEVSYLLQRVEEYDGLAILATNLRANMDVAFLGRFDAVVRFSMPARKERERIWRAAMPREPAPSKPEAFARAMSRFELSGRSIVNAAHYAALAGLDAERSALTYEDASEGVRRELEKEGRVFRDLLEEEIALERENDG